MSGTTIWGTDVKLVTKKVIGVLLITFSKFAFMCLIVLPHIRGERIMCHFFPNATCGKLINRVFELHNNLSVVPTVGILSKIPV